MEEENQQPSAVRDGGVGVGSVILAAEETGAPQNGELAKAEETERSGFRRRHSSSNSEQMKAAEGSGGKGVTPPEEPPRKRFQIPRKSRDKKALQPISSDSREFEEILKILHSSCLDANSKIHFTYKSARLVHNEFLEKEFTEKRRQLKFDGRLEKELAESYAFLLVDEDRVQNICEKGLHVGHSKLTTLGKPSKGVYLSKYADLLQANPLEASTAGSIFIFKIIKGKMKAVYDNFRNNQDSVTGNGNLDPAPKHECHVLKNLNAVTSLLSYRAFERTQYYFYEYGFDDILKRPRHVCPHAVVSFGYKTDQKPRQSPSPLSGPVSFSSDRYSDRSTFILWRGQLLSKGKLLCFASLKSTSGPFFPYKLPDKLDLDIVMRLEQIKKRIPPLLFYKETHKSKEVVKGGIHSRLYEVSDKTRTGNDFQGLLHKLEKEKLALVKPLTDRGFLFFYFPTPMTTSYGVHSTKAYPLHALFIYQGTRECRKPESHFTIQPSFMQDNHELMPDLFTFIASLHWAFLKCQTDTSDHFNIVVEKHVRIYLKRRAEGSFRRNDSVLKGYDPKLDSRKNLYAAPRDRSRVHAAVNSYIHGSEAYTLPVERAKELVVENQRVQQFSPVSDYEPIEDDHEAPSIMNREVVSERLPDNAEYDMDKLNGLINLIYIMKNNASGNPETDNASNSGLKSKPESSPEAEWKPHKPEDYFNSNREEAVDSTHSVSSLICALGGQDTDLRQDEPEPEPNIADPEYYKVLFEKLTDSGLLDSLNKLLPSQNKPTEETVQMECSPSSDTVDNSADNEQSTCAEQQIVDHLESCESLATSPADNGLVRTEVDGNDHPSPVEESIQEPYSSCASPCPSTPTEQVYPQPNSSPKDVECEMPWKLIPITGEEGRAPEDHVENLSDEKQQGLSLTEEQSVYLSPKDALPNDPRFHKLRRSRGSGYSPLEEYRKGKRRSSRYERGPYRDHAAKRGHDFFKTRHCQNGVIENTVQEVYSKFSEQLQEVLREKDISFTGISTPLLSSDERTVRLSDWLCAQASDISVQQYVDELRVKLDSVVASYISSSEIGRPINAAHEAKEPVESFVPQVDRTSVAMHTNLDISQTLETLQSSGLIRNGCIEQVLPNNAQDAPLDGNPGTLGDAFPHFSQGSVLQNPEKATSNLPDNITASHTALADLINQMHPEVFNNLVKIFTHVNKNIVKFYIHTEEEDNTICCEIKDYLIKLGNVQCYPEQFVHCNAVSDKLLIIIQNEDIAHSIHKIPSLITLKRRPCVSFAGVDSLDDLKNHTYNELFVSGGFIVSDETVLNPDPVTVDKLKKFLLFLEQIDSPEGKWQWKIHCKFQKKLKELGRVNKHAPNILALLNTYQKKHLVEILSYHNCDSQTRQAPELDCLIKLQVQNIQQRHLIFLTEKDASLFATYAENGIVVTRMDDFMHHFTSLVGHHSSSSEENCLSHLVNQENQTAPSEADVKEEEDMSLDSGDETPQIEVCTGTANMAPHRDEAVSRSAFLDSQTEGSRNKTPTVDSDYMQPVTPVSTTGSSTGDTSIATGGDLSNSFQDYHSRQLGISHFNLLTHQTFLGSTLYPLLGNQMPAENYFINPYSQPMEQETSQHSEWDQKWNVK